MGLQRGQEKVDYTSTWPRKTEVESLVHTPFFWGGGGYCSDFWLLKKLHFLKFSFLTLCSCLQHLHNDFLLLNKESMPDLVIDTFSTHGTTTGLLMCFRSENLMRTLCLTVRTPQSPPGHTPRVDVGAFPASSVYHAPITWLIMHWSRNWSCTFHLADHALITWLIIHWSRDWSCTDHVTDHALIT